MFEYAKKVFKTLFFDKSYSDPAIEEAKKTMTTQMTSQPKNTHKKIATAHKKMVKKAPAAVLDKEKVVTAKKK